MYALGENANRALNRWRGLHIDDPGIELDCIWNKLLITAGQCCPGETVSYGDIGEEAYEALQVHKEFAKQLTAHEALDEMIHIFCVLHGGLEECMPMVRKKFAEAEVDFANPDKAGLERVMGKLADLTTFLKGEEIGQMARKKFRWLVRQIP